MKLSTELKPRTDGTVRVAGLDGKSYVFKGDPLECDVTDEATLAHLLALDTFFPSSDDDHAAALALVQASTKGEGSGPQGAERGGPDDDLDDELVDMNAPPIEANTPPKDAVAEQAAQAAQQQAAKAATQQRRTRAS